MYNRKDDVSTRKHNSVMHFTKILIQISQENFHLQELSQGDQIRRHSF